MHTATARFGLLAILVLLAAPAWAQEDFEITFQVDMNDAITNCALDPESDQVISVPGEHNGWDTAASVLSDGDGDGIYGGTITVSSDTFGDDGVLRQEVAGPPRRIHQFERSGAGAGPGVVLDDEVRAHLGIGGEPVHHGHARGDEPDQQKRRRHERGLRPANLAQRPGAPPDRLDRVHDHERHQRKGEPIARPHLGPDEHDPEIEGQEELGDTGTDPGFDMGSGAPAGGSAVVVRYRLRATCSGTDVDVPGIMWCTVIDGEITHRTDLWDSLTFLRQTGRA